MDQNLLNIASAIIVAGGAVGVIWGLVRPLARKVKGMMHSLDMFILDWFGSEEAPGRDAVPGVMERLNNIDGELKHNGGSTMKDAMKRIEDKLSEIDERLDEGNKRFQEIEKRLDK